MIKKQPKMTGMLCGFFTGICWGLSGIFSQYLFTNTDMSSGWFVAVRMIISGLCMLVLSVPKRKNELRDLWFNKKDLLLCIIIGIIGNMCFQFSCYGAVEKSNAATAIVLQYLCPIMVVIYTCIRSGKLPKKLEVISVFLALLGIFMISTHGKPDVLIITPEALLWGVGCAFFMMLISVMPEKLYRKYSAQTVTGVALFAGGVVANVLIRPWQDIPRMNKEAMCMLAFAVFCGSIIAYIVYGIAVKKLGASTASLCACIEIPTATVLSVLFLGNSFTIQDLTGFVMIASTIFLLQKKPAE
jgi:drug/metabolite transporter (DMT)-like permease